MITDPSSLAQAKQLFNDRFRVRFNFDGAMETTENGPGEHRRAMGFGGDKSSFSWKGFLTLDNCYNPYPGQLNPWSLKAWYKWGCRKFHLHCPFGKVADGHKQGLVYEVDQFLNARDGLTLADGTVQNTPMPWLVQDFVPVFRALTTGQRGSLDAATWDSWTVGPDAWFNPAEPIDAIIYVGAMADPGTDLAYAEYVARWNRLFNSNPSAAAKRLRDSVTPFIDANCRLAFDAAVASPGAVSGQRISTAVQGTALQKGWWVFWTWVGIRIGKSRMYVESHPFRKAGQACSYLGYNVIADDDWSATPVVPPGPDGPHMTSEMGEAEFWRAIWQNTNESTPLVAYKDASGALVPGRYSFLEPLGQSVQTPSGNLRLAPACCCDKGHNYYYSHLYHSLIAYHLLEPQHTFGETAPRRNITRSGMLVPNSLLQVLPPAYSGDPDHSQQFGARFKTSDDFVGWLAACIDRRRETQSEVYDFRA